MNTRAVVVLALLAIVCVSCAHAATEVLKSETFRVGPFAIAAGGSTSPSTPLTRPAVGKRIAIRTWGAWDMIDVDTGLSVPRPEVYLHHSFFYNNAGQFITGTSNERDSWGPEGLNFPYRLILDAHHEVSGSIMFVNMSKSKPANFYLQYTVEYADEIHPDTRAVESVIFSNGANIPGNGGAGSIHTTVLDNNQFSFDGMVVYLNAHMHQGGRRMQLVDPSTDQVFCSTKPIYSADSACFHDCMTACTTNKWTEGYHKSTPPCITEKPIKAGSSLKSIIEYDNSCAWSGTHSWWFMFAWRSNGAATEYVAPATAPEHHHHH